MHRIDVPSATVDDLFTEGSPTGGVPATTVSADWLNDLQENVCNAIEDAGLTLTKGDYDQLTQAIIALAAAAFTGANQNLAASGFQKLPGGLIFQWTSVLSATEAPGSTAFSWPMTFPNAVFRTLAVETGTSATSVSAMKLINPTTSGGSVTHKFVLGSSAPSAHIFGIGR